MLIIETQSGKLSNDNPVIDSKVKGRLMTDMPSALTDSNARERKNDCCWYDEKRMASNFESMSE